jgi:glycosyltransferase involved in cell wall biosynthesis
MRICFLGLENLPVLAPEYRHHSIGGEQVQQTLLARALAQRGYEVSMVVGDYGQADGAVWSGIRAFKAYRFDAGVPVLRFVHPRWTGVWQALKRADADVYYTSCAGMHVGLVALFCRRFGRRFVFRTASNPDCERSRLRVLVRFARDRWLYAYGLKHADAILVQSASQARALAASYGLGSRVAAMLVEQPGPACARDIDVLWVGNIQAIKRPDRILRLAEAMPDLRFHMVGGSLAGREDLYCEVQRAALGRRNLAFHGRLSYWAASALYGRAQLLVNTSDVEGFPNTYLQAWIRGVPVVTLIDPDGVIEREGLGLAARSETGLADGVRYFFDDPHAWQAASGRCRRFMAREYGEDKVLRTYVETFEQVMRAPAQRRTVLPRPVRHV